MRSSFSFQDEETGWNNPKKTKKQKELLSYRGKVLNQRMAYPFDYKITLAKRRIQAAIDQYGEEDCYVSFSGGKDSTILSHLVLSMGYKLEHVFSNTRLEYPECIKFSKEWCKKNGIKLNLVLPDILPHEVWKKHGYPMFSKEIAELLGRMWLGYKCHPKKIKKVKGFLKRLGYNGDPSDSKKVKNFLKRKGLKISSKCCYLLKKKPMKEWQKRSGKKVAIMGVRAEESQIRRTVWVRKGCIYETKDQVVVHPIIFFTEKDIFEYAKKYDIRFADIYYEPHNLKRNGCFCCGFGCHMTEENNFIKLKQMNPQLWASIMNHWGFSKICEKCNVKIE
ncbi:MAG: phosphoadenosine phosphosulfate reductase family protein [Nanoarchaeota archaeon]|nr:phosphoadenosine phosphosulfate reductase family protein [DPANN group archaeon]MBL7116872.1 phosphoadenosine phosphosulfate reductase family protein [Nanoarchaeota archaeon]